EDIMRKILSLAVLAAGLAVGGVAYAQSSSSSGTGGANVGDSMKQPMIVSADNGNVRMQPNATSKILTTVPHGHQVIMVGTTNGGAWPHLTVDGVEGISDLLR